VAAAEHLVLDEPGPWPLAVSPTTTCSPSTTMTPSTMRALWVALRPHQHSASTWSTCTRSASSMSRLRPGEELGAEVGGDPEGVDVDVELVDEPGQLLDLLGV
jgi:hypothetical protein